MDSFSCCIWFFTNFHPCSLIIFTFMICIYVKKKILIWVDCILASFYTHFIMDRWYTCYKLCSPVLIHYLPWETWALWLILVWFTCVGLHSRTCGDSCDANCSWGHGLQWWLFWRDEVVFLSTLTLTTHSPISWLLLSLLSPLERLATLPPTSCLNSTRKTGLQFCLPWGVEWCWVLEIFQRSMLGLLLAYQL